MLDDLPAGLEIAPDVSAAEWLAERIWPWPTPDNHTLAGSIVPEGFESYAAVRHEGGHDFDLSEREARALVAVLGRSTTGTDECWFCLWTGYGDMNVEGVSQSVFRVSSREYLLLRGPLSAVVHFAWARPKVWWPSDRSWCVGGDIDLTRTFVGGTEDTVAALADTEDLDVERVSLDVRIDGTNSHPRLGSG